MAAQGARLRSKGAAPTAVSQSQFSAAPPPMAAKPVSMRVWRRAGIGIAKEGRIAFESWVTVGFIPL
ncbi:hypothetical protein OIHEL45_02870 [Sulfitobacter indolifex HEL-45]|uniref:Uncharacterized protein n=1 Tax=Sulfitobacter indolifex HEL-45 TaxID=391624 RepID=A0ABP2DBM7_9RHOB|nr:hypothetical protein OIHEL45_02870 [Sulfitobacter indolifex HEL-45]